MTGDKNEDFMPKIRCETPEKAQEIVSRTWVRPTMETSVGGQINFWKSGRLIGHYRPVRGGPSGYLQVKRNIASMTDISEALRNFKKV